MAHKQFQTCENRGFSARIYFRKQNLVSWHVEQIVKVSQESIVAEAGKIIRFIVLVAGQSIVS